MSSLALTAVAGISSGAIDGTFTVTACQTGEAVRFGDGLHGAAPPLGSGSLPPANHAAGGGASGNSAGATPQPHEDGALLRSAYREAEFGAEGRHFSGILMQQGRVQTDVEDRQGVPSHLDSMSEMGETESLRLQMAMDRLSKMMSTLSNLLQRIVTTSAGIIQNMK